MKACKVLSCLLVLVLLLGSLLPIQAQAIDLIDLTARGSLTITAVYGDTTPLKGAAFRLYRVATPDEQCHLTSTGKFDLTGVDLNKLDQAGWEELAGDLEEQVNENMTADYGGKPGDPVTNGEGVVTFSDLELGLYLVLGVPHKQDLLTYEQDPVLVMVPNRNMTGDDIDSWHYQVSVKGKPVTAKDSLEVVKLWDDKNDAAHKRPGSITVYLLKNGKRVENVPGIQSPVVLNKHNNWRYLWENLECGVTWAVEEDTSGLAGLNYVAGKPVRDDKGTDHIIYTITNKYSPPPPKLPQTGQLWWPVPVLLSAGLLCMLVALIRRRGEKDEA